MAMEKAAMRAYVTAADHAMYSQLADGTVQVTVTHSNLQQRVLELRLDLHSSIKEIKQKLYTHNGTNTAHMDLVLKDTDGTPLAKMSEEDRPLGYYGVDNGMEIHVIDTDPFSLSKDGGLDDVTRIQKYRMSDEDYDKRENTLRAYKKKMLAQNPDFKFLPESKRPGAAPASAEKYLPESCIEGLTVGARCELKVGGRRGEVKYLGKVPSIGAGYWVGAQLDEPTGKGDGSRGGVSYFDCPDKYGIFVRPDMLVTGDFPVIDHFADMKIGEEAGSTAGQETGVEGEGQEALKEEKAAGGAAAGAKAEAAADAGCCAEHDHAGHSHAAAGGAGAPAPVAGGAAAAAPAAGAAAGAGAGVVEAAGEAPSFHGGYKVYLTKVAGSGKPKRRGEDSDDDSASDDEL